MPPFAPGQWSLLALLFVSGFSSATVLPGNSEVAFGLYLRAEPVYAWVGLLVVSLGNLLGGLTTVWLGRRLPPPEAERPWLRRLRRFGTPLLVLTPLPLAGDALAAAAGWLRLPWLGIVFWSALGRFGRYWLLLELLH